MDSCTFRNVSYIYVLHRCHLSQQSTWILLVLYAEMKCWHWLYSSAIDPQCFCPHETHNALCFTPCQLSRPCWWKADLLMAPSAADCLRSDASVHLSICTLSFSLLLPLSVCGDQRAALPSLQEIVRCSCVSLKIAYAAGSCKRRPGNTSQQHYWFSPSHGLLFLLDLWIYM